jgi:hypothetical protein
MTSDLQRARQRANNAPLLLPSPSRGARGAPAARGSVWTVLISPAYRRFPFAIGVGLGRAFDASSFGWDPQPASIRGSSTCSPATPLALRTEAVTSSEAAHV